MGKQYCKICQSTYCQGVFIMGYGPEGQEEPEFYTHKEYKQILHNQQKQLKELLKEGETQSIQPD